jgi:hypothetical protein
MMPGRRAPTMVVVKVLVIVNDQPYGSERPYNALRLADALSKRHAMDAAEARRYSNSRPKSGKARARRAGGAPGRGRARRAGTI